MNFRAAIFAAGLIIPTRLLAYESISVSSVPFQSVDYLSGLNSQIVFDSVKLKDRSWKIAVLVDKVEVVLLEEKNIYTTLNLIKTQEDYGNLDWMKAEKVTVVVRQKGDLILWQKFLTRVKRQQEFERKKWAEPIRVLPPAK